MSVFQGLCPCLTRSPVRSVARLLRVLFVDIGSAPARQTKSMGLGVFRSRGSLPDGASSGRYLLLDRVNQSGSHRCRSLNAAWGLRRAKRREYDWVTIAEHRMTPERWRQIEDLYNLACDRGDGVLADADPDLRREIQEMLAQKSGGKILDQAAFDLMTDSSQTQVMAGSRLGPYRIEALLGQGGMGQVFRAIDTRLGREVAIRSRKKGSPTGLNAKPEPSPR